MIIFQSQGREPGGTMAVVSCICAICRRVMCLRCRDSDSVCVPSSVISGVYLW